MAIFVDYSVTLSKHSYVRKIKVQHLSQMSFFSTCLFDACVIKITKRREDGICFFFVRAFNLLLTEQDSIMKCPTTRCRINIFFTTIVSFSTATHERKETLVHPHNLCHLICLSNLQTDCQSNHLTAVF